MARFSRHRSFIGGLDLTTSEYEVRPERARLALNFECLIDNGLQREPGYERYDGQSLPSTGVAYYCEFVGGISEISVGESIVGVQSAATAVVIEIDLDSGGWAEGDAAGHMLITRITGQWLQDEEIERALDPGVVSGQISVLPYEEYEDTVEMLRQRGVAHEELRDQITAVPGEGPIRGLLGDVDGTLYAFRDNVGATEGAIYKSTSSGWELVPPGVRMSISTGTSQILPGDTVEGVTSGETAVVSWVEVARDGNGDPTGEWATSDWAGFLWVHSVSGAFTPAELIKVGVTNSATYTGASTMTRAPGGRVRSRWHNFYGDEDWGGWCCADGVNQGFIFDGLGYARITTGMIDDTPDHVAVFGERLVYVFGGSLQRSAAADPFVWTVILGAGELGLGERAAELLETTFALFMLGPTMAKVLYILDDGSWKFDPFSASFGCVSDSSQSYISGLYARSDGIVRLDTSDTFGNFKSAIINDDIDPLYRDFVTNSQIVGSAVVAAKNQYRLFTTDGRIISITFSGNKLSGFGTAEYPLEIAYVHTGRDKRVYIGDEDGMAYLMGSGPSYDGEEVLAIYRSPFDHCGFPDYEKRLFYAKLEMEAPRGTVIQAQPVFSFDSEELLSATNLTLHPDTSGAYWDIDMTWGEFFWGGQTVYNETIDMEGMGENIAVLLSSQSTYADPYKILGVQYFLQRLSKVA